MKIDLHCHSCYSDGDCSPAEVLALALSNQVDVVALTDHDTLDGYWELQNLAKNTPLCIVPGVECSVTWQGLELHVLGLDLDPNHAGLRLLLQQQAQRRFARALQISQLLCDLGLKNNLMAVIEIAGHYGLSRTHFAKYLLAQNLVPDMQTAFKKYLGRRAPAYVHSNWVSLPDVIRIISDAGGQAVLAHPLHYQLSQAQLRKLVQEFKSAGGQGLEAISGYTKMVDIQKILKLAEQFDLHITSGSDFHRPSFYRPSIGQQPGLPSDCREMWLKIKNCQKGNKK